MATAPAGGLIYGKYYMIGKKISGFLKFFTTHKIISGLIIAPLAIGGYFGYQKMTTSAQQISYLTQPAAMGAVTVAVSGTGEVSAANQVDIKPDASGR